MKEKNQVALKLDKEYARHKKELEKIGVAGYMEGCILHVNADEARIGKTISTSKKDGTILMMEFIKAIRNDMMRTNECSKEEADIAILAGISASLADDKED